MNDAPRFVRICHDDAGANRFYVVDLYAADVIAECKPAEAEAIADALNDAPFPKRTRAIFASLKEIHRQ